MNTGNRFYFLLISFILVVLGYLTFTIIKPFLSPILWAIVLTVLFYPVYTFSLKYVKSKSLASVVSLVALLIILFGPVSYLAFLITQDIISFAQNLESGTFDSLMNVLKKPAAFGPVSKVLSLLHISEQEFQKGLTTNLTKFGQGFAGMLKSGLGNIVSGVFNFILMLLTTFFLLVDGPRFIEQIGSFIPFSAEEKGKLFKQTKDIVISTMYGGVAVAAAQAIIAAILFIILGIPSAVIWALAMFVASFIPVVGTFIVWGPAAIYLFIMGSYIKGIILVVLSIGGISSIDNILRPIIMKGRTKMPTIVILFSIIGGIQVFGFIGLIAGPLVFALFVSVFHIFRYSEEKPDTRES
ncbi:MAG TPA: AI-2E family transporter [Syntrophorhabdaceae bacterium]|nr:AI-2E family transporter [Syntrophorhabdaceae bacterium]